VLRFAGGERVDFPPFPENYFPLRERAVLEEYRERLTGAVRRAAEPPPFPEEIVAERLDNTWHDTAEAVINNWIGKVYQLTHRNRRLPFMEGVDADDPLGLGWGRKPAQRG
jgi:homoserine O-succinyltransferase